MSTLNYTILQFVQECESVEVIYSHSDLSSAIAQIYVCLSKGEGA